MKPSVARRCKDQEREDEGREERCVSGVCTGAWAHFLYCMCESVLYVCVCGDGGQAEREMEHYETEAELWE